eukprot:15363347-Ditylum_brightwellii.AAC.1
MLDGADGTMVASVDVKNGYNKIIHSAFLEAIWDYPDLHGTYIFFHKLLQVHSYNGLGGSTYLTPTDFTCSKGVQQGAVEASFLSCMGTNKANQATHRDLFQTGGGLAAGMDETCILRQPDVVIATVPTHRT